MTLKSRLRKDRVTKNMHLMVGYYRNCWLNLTLCNIDSIPKEFVDCAVIENEYLTVNGIDYYKIVVEY